MVSPYEKELILARRRQEKQAADLAETLEMLKQAGASMPITRKLLIEKEKRQRMVIAGTLNVIAELEAAAGALPLEGGK